MSKKVNYHIFWEKWTVTIKKEGNTRATLTDINSRSEAYKITKKLSLNQGGWEIMIHDLRWKINVKNTMPFWNDPRNIKG